MNSNLLTTRIKGIQIEYKELLSKLSPKLKSGQVPEALDELNLFWLRHIDEVQQYDFDKKLLHALSMHGINEENFENRIVPQIITDELEKFYSTLLVSE